MDNLTHSLVGAALAEVALPDGASRASRRLLFTVAIVASSLPDADLSYSSFASPPIGYLLHHRGYTHTLLGLFVQGLLLAAVLQLVPALRRLTSAYRWRLWVLVAVSLLGHLFLDSWNTYGVHPFYPFDARWFYGDAVFIFEPWLYVLLGVSAAWNARGSLGRILTAVLVTAAVLALGYFGALSVGMVLVLAGAAIVLAWAVGRLAPRKRATAALAAGGLLVASLFGLSRLARAETLAQVASPAGGEVVDVVLNPDPAAPWCWTAITIERNEPAGEFVLRRGTLSLLPAWQPPANCASHRLVAGADIGASADGRMLWRDEIHQTLASLRDLNQQDCRASAWLQFGRVPFVRDGALRDLRFETRLRTNFSALRLDSRSVGCPPHLTHWAQPRADLLQPGRGSS